MKSIRKGLREGNLEKDTYGRLSCTICASSLQMKDDPDTLGSVRVCPDCQNEWRAIG